jgi:hypothetical protein
MDPLKSLQSFLSTLQAAATTVERAVLNWQRRVERIDQLAVRKFAHRKRHVWKPADVPKVTAIYKNVSSGTPQAVMQNMSEVWGRRGRPALSHAGAASPINQLTAWLALPADTPAQRRQVVLKSPIWPSIAAQAYAGEHARILSAREHSDRSPSEQAELNVAKVFGVSWYVIRRDKTGIAVYFELIDVNALEKWRQFIDHGID